MYSVIRTLSQEHGYVNWTAIRTKHPTAWFKSIFSYSLTSRTFSSRAPGLMTLWVKWKYPAFQSAVACKNM